MRTISLKLLTQVQLETVNTNARTVAEFINEIQSGPLADKINVGEVKFIDKATYAEFGDIPEALLPSGNCILFVTPRKTKAGATITVENVFTFPEEEVLDFVEEMGYNEVRSFGSSLNKQWNARIDLSGKRINIVENVIDYLEEAFSAPIETTEEEVFNENKAMLIAAIELIEKVITNLKTTESFAIGVTYEELQNEAERLRDLLNK